MRNSNNKSNKLIAADLTNISTREQTSGLTDLFFNLSNYAGTSTFKFSIYEYEQDLIKTNTNLPVFVASPKLFALMNDTTCQTIERDGINVRQIEMNGKIIELASFGDVAFVKKGIDTGENNHFLYQNPLAKRQLQRYKPIQRFFTF